MTTLEIDSKGRLVIPKSIREEAEISIPSELVVVVEGVGWISLQSIEINLKNAQQIGGRKLSSWTEERHEEDRLIRRENLK
jgi:bifunctional DNA-binding transcriptional regulator/antitoxin component of YhaV-PrlF toxin-antitoxin module